MERGINQGKDADFNESLSDDGRRFFPSWFVRKLATGECLERKWMIYSRKSKKLFCFPCMLFSNKSVNSAKMINANEGFNNWKALKPRVPNHENSFEHRKNYMK